MKRNKQSIAVDVSKFKTLVLPAHFGVFCGPGNRPKLKPHTSSLTAQLKDTGLEFIAVAANYWTDHYGTIAEVLSQKGLAQFRPVKVRGGLFSSDDNSPTGWHQLLDELSCQAPEALVVTSNVYYGLGALQAGFGLVITLELFSGRMDRETVGMKLQRLGVVRELPEDWFPKNDPGRTPQTHQEIDSERIIIVKNIDQIAFQ